MVIVYCIIIVGRLFRLVSSVMIWLRVESLLIMYRNKVKSVMKFKYSIVIVL